MSEASFAKREVAPGDPVICDLCGATIGTRGGLATPEARKSAEAAHEPTCSSRRTHQRRHRRTDGPCPVCIARRREG